MSKLYELTTDLLTLQELLESPLDDEEILKDTLEAVQGEYELKLEAYCKVIKNLEADIDALKNEAKRLTDKRKTLEGNVDRLKKAMFDSMKATGTERVKGQLFTVAIQKNGGKLPIVLDVDASKLPNKFVKVEKTPNLEAIYEVLNTNGTCNFAHFGERGESLRIK